jgi:hypothetical protein
MINLKKRCLIIFLSLFFINLCVESQEIKSDIPNQDKNQNNVSSSPKAPWGDFEVVKEEEQTVLTKVLLWVPNRILDFIDIFRVDVGAGLGTGAVIRLTKYVQAGVRLQTPGMLRVGAFGREAPVRFELESEIGVSPIFEQSDSRNLCKGITAVGVDAILLGAHLGFCPEEVVDFLGGIITLDMMDDDL